MGGNQFTGTLPDGIREWAEVQHVCVCMFAHNHRFNHWRTHWYHQIYSVFAVSCWRQLIHRLHPYLDWSINKVDPALCRCHIYQPGDITIDTVFFAYALWPILQLYQNQFSGTLPDSLGQLSLLTEVGLLSSRGSMIRQPFPHRTTTALDTSWESMTMYWQVSFLDQLVIWPLWKGSMWVQNEL